MGAIAQALAVTFGAAVTWSRAPVLGPVCSIGWQAPRDLVAADGRPAYVETPAAVSTRDGALLLGTPAVLWAQRDAFDPAPGPDAADTAAYFVRLRANHGFVGFVLGGSGAASPVRPPEVPAVRKLVAARGTSGTIHVVWFAPAPHAKDRDRDGAVWYAERQGSRWNTPTMLFAADRLDWSGQRASVLVSGSDVHVVVAYSRTGKEAGIAYMRRTGGRWRTTETLLRGLPSQATPQLIGTDSLAVAFAGVGAPDVREPNGQHIYLIRAALSDTIWPPPRRIQWSGRDAVRWLTMYRLPASGERPRTLALIWARVPHQGSGSADAIYAMRSDNGGAMWTAPQELRLPIGADDLTQAQDADGDVHVVLAPSPAWAVRAVGSTPMHHAVLRSGSWGPATALPAAGPAASAPALWSIARDTLLLVWGEARPAGGGVPAQRVAPLSKYAFFVRACRPGRGVGRRLVDPHQPPYLDHPPSAGPFLHDVVVDEAVGPLRRLSHLQNAQGLVSRACACLPLVDAGRRVRARRAR